MATKKQAPLVRQIMKFATIPDAADALSNSGVNLIDAFTTIMFLAGQVSGLECQLEAMTKAKTYRKMSVKGAITGRHSCSGRIVAPTVSWANPIDWKVSPYSSDPRVDSDAPGF